MALTTWYSTGTVSVESGSTTVTATGALWGGDAIMAGDLFCDPAQPLVPPQRVKEVTSDTTLELWTAWPGADMADAAYEIRYVGIIERSTAQTRRVLEQLGEVDAYFDVQVDELADRAVYDDRPAGYRVLVSNTGDGRSAIYSKHSATNADWSDPAFITGPAVTLDVGSVTEVPFGTSPDVTLTPVGGGYEFNFDLPAAATLTTGAVTTLAPGQDVTFTLNPVSGGYQIDVGIPKGDTGDVDGVTPFWQGRITQDQDAEAAWAGLELSNARGAIGSLASGEVIVDDDYLITRAVAGRVLTVNGAWELTFDPAADLGSDFSVIVRTIGEDDITLTPNGSDVIDGELGKTLRSGNSVVVFSNGDELMTVLSGSTSHVGGPHKIAVVESSGTYDFDPETKRAFVEIIGGGGGGGDAGGTGSGEAAYGAGGGGGGYCAKLIESPTTAAIAIGAGGTNAAAGGNTTYADGTVSMTANGGSPGGTRNATVNTVLQASSGGMGGAASGGDININGSPGATGIYGNGGRGYGGQGGNSQLGAGGSSIWNGSASSGVNGDDAEGWGGGGGGAGNAEGQPSRPGGLGGNGVCIIREFK